MNPNLKTALLKLYDESYNKKAWHGQNLFGSIRGITIQQASWRPEPGRHNIREIVIHCAYWKYTVRRRILGEKHGSFPLKGSNWFRIADDNNEKAWRNEKELLNEYHRLLRVVIDDLTLSDLLTGKSNGVNNGTLITGIASHDVYHAGQIQLIKRLQQ